MQLNSETAERLVAVYLHKFAHGEFPMGIPGSDYLFEWHCWPIRAILPLDNFHFPRRLRRKVRRQHFSATVNKDFEAVIRNCANREERWINKAIVELFTELHMAGIAHSVEVRIEGQLVGGLYGVAIGGVFSGESMFSLIPSASQIALLHLVDMLILEGFEVLDVQGKTEHLERFGVIEILYEEYLELLHRGLASKAKFPVHPEPEASSSVLQRMSQKS